MLRLRYQGAFLSRKSVPWRVDILQESDTEFDVGDLIFEAEEALVIEWEDKSKEESILGSTATLQIESPGDRTYEDLYTIEPGNIRMDVYRDGELYWSGLLDPEFYEEPYERASKYTVSLTFSDFGILDRLKYDLSGLQVLSDIFNYAIEKSGLNVNGIDYDTYCTTYFDDETTKANLSALSIQSENFFDEDGEASTLMETLEGFLQPLGLRMVQKAGMIYVYDLNGLYENATTREIKWDGDSQTMGVDKVANNVKISFSPYSNSTLLDTEVEYTDPYSVEATNLTNTNPNDEYGEYYSWYPDYTHQSDRDWDYDNVNFTIFISKNGSGLESIHSNARYFHIEPQVGSATECDGVAWGFYTGGQGDLVSGYPEQKLRPTTADGDNLVLMKSNQVYIPTLSKTDASQFYLRVTLEMLLDSRYNPFTEAGEYNEKLNSRDFKVYTGWAFVPVIINLYCEDGTVLHYSNEDIAKGGRKGRISEIQNGKWLDGEGTRGEAWLEYYDTDDQEEQAGILGWKANRHCIGRNDGKSGREENYLYESFKAMEDGQYLPYPEKGGRMEIIVYTGVRCYDYGESGTWEQTEEWDDHGLYSLVRWNLYKSPKIDIVRNNIVFDEAELDDVEYNGYLNKAAKEEISIDTICGTADKACPTARGIYHRASDGYQIQMLHRAGFTDHPEKLFIGTLYSQFAERHTKLEGDSVLDYEGLCTYTERNQGDKIFMCTGEVQDVIMDVSDTTFIELLPDEYEGVEYE